jgi:hypothetical protein
MKKTFPLQIPGRVDARVVEGVKADLRKYVQRERRKALPAGFTQWNFICRVGPAADSAGACPVAGLSSAVDEVVRGGGRTVYVEIVAEPGTRTPAPTGG